MGSRPAETDSSPDGVKSDPDLVTALHKLHVERGRYIVAKCTGCTWIAPEPFGYLSSAKNAHAEHVSALLRGE